MSPSVDQHILDKVTAELFDSGNYRQALKNTEKKLKKTPNSVHLLTLKALLLCEIHQNEESKSICSRLIAQQPAISASNEVAFLFSTVCRLDQHGTKIKPQEVEALWKNAIAHRQSKADKHLLAKRWADLSVLECNWVSFMKAAAQLQKSVDQSSQDFRRYVFWEAVGSYISSMHMSTERERQISRKLSLRKLQLNAGLSSGASDSMLLLANWITTSEEQLLTQELVLSSSDQLSDSKVFLSSASSLKNGEVVSGAWLEQLQSRETILLKNGNFDDAYSLSLDVLHEAQQHRVDYLSDDWHNLRTLKDSALNSQDSINIQKLTSELKENFSLGPAMSRGIREAYLSFVYEQQRRIDVNQKNGVQTETKYLTAFKEHFRTYATYAWGIESLLPQIIALDKRERLEARKFMTDHVQNILKPGHENSEILQLKWITAECKLLHLDMEIIKSALVTPAGDSSSNATQEDLIDIVVRCIRLYKISRCHTAQLAKTEVDPGNKACLLAVEGLIALSRRKGSQLYLIQAVLLLECARRDSNDNDIKIKEILLLRNLGLSSLALAIYKDIGVKQVLCDSMSPIYFTRSGTLLPSSDPQMDLYRIFERNLNFYVNALSKIPDHQQMALSHQNYQSAVDMEKFRQALTNSLTRRMLIYERKRVARMSGVAFEGAAEDEYKVTADTKYVEPLNCKAPTAKGIFSKSEYVVTNEYVYWLTVVDEVHEIIRAKELHSPTFALLTDLNNLEALTVPEKGHYTFASIAAEILSRVLLKGATAESFALLGLIEKLVDWMTTTWENYQNNPFCRGGVTGKPFVDSEDFQQAYLLAEAFQTSWCLADKISAFVKSQKAIPKDQSKNIGLAVKQIQDTATGKLMEIRRNAELRKSKLNEATAKCSTFSEIMKLCGAEENTKIGQMVADLIGERWIKHDFSQFVKSSRSALEAVMLLKLPKI